MIKLIDKDPAKAISLFWSAINSGDRVDSALKDMAIVMKQLNRSDEAIEAMKSFRHLCPYDSQESIDNVLIELYKVEFFYFYFLKKKAFINFSSNSLTYFWMIHVNEFNLKVRSIKD